MSLSSMLEAVGQGNDRHVVAATITIAMMADQRSTD
jgi:hypothetical protein